MASIGQNSFLQKDVSDLLSVGGQVVRWWRSALGPGVAERIESVLLDEPAAHFVDFEQLTSDALTGGVKARASEPLVCRVPASKLYQREIECPFAAPKDLEGMIFTDLSRYVPLPRGQVEIDLKHLGRDPVKRTALVQLTVMRANDVSRAQAACEQAGFTLNGFCAEGPYKGFATSVFSFCKTRPPAFLVRLWAAPLLVFGMIGLIWCSLAVTVAGQSAAITKLHLEVSGVQTQAKQVQQTQAALSRLAKAYREDVLNGRHAEPLHMLGRLASALPDNSWVEDVRVQGNVIRLRGRSEDGSPLVSVLSAVDGFEEVQLASPLVRQGQSERFDLEFKLVPSTRAAK